MKTIEKWQWALLIVYACGTIKGKTRYHKLAFAITKLTKGLEKLGYFDDWESKDYGMFSRKLQTQIDNLHRNGLVISHTSDDGTYEIFQPSEDVEDVLKEIIPSVDKYLRAIRKINDAYSEVSLDEFLHNMYTRYPEFAEKSRIKGRIIATDYAIKEKDIKMPTSLPEDYDVRLRLSKMIGLKDVPKHNPHALYELAGISAKKIKLKTIDAVELVSESRNADN